MRAALGVIALLLLTSGAQAATVPAAAEPITALDNGLIAAMQGGKAPFATRYAALKPIIEQAFDLETILQTSVGPRWASIPAAQQSTLRTEFERFTVSSYVSNFNAFGGEKFELVPEQRAVGADQVVATRLIPATGSPVKLDYVMRQSAAGWRAVDVLLDGSISRVAVQRSDFRSLLSGGPDALVDSLRKKIADLSGGATLP